MTKIRELQQYSVQLLVECFATCVLILFGEAGNANYKFSRQTAYSTLPVSITFGVGVYVGKHVYACNCWFENENDDYFSNND